jgi:lipoprotein-anchoring transpeptidase ErfK/SrfK
LAQRLHSSTAQGWREQGSGAAMKTCNLSKWAMTAAVAVAFGLQLAAQAPQHNRVVIVSLKDRKLALVEDGQVKKVYTVAVGKRSTPSPVGTFKIERRVANPVYHHDGQTVMPGPGNPVGTRWMGLNLPGYGIHGTNVPKSIGKAASHGCIRMAKTDLEEFYSLVAVGDTVELIGQRNEETAAVFNNAEAPAMQQPTSLAQSAPDQEPAPAAPKTDPLTLVAARAAGSR